MENASKALIIAGEMLIAMLIVSLLLYAWTSYSKYKKNQIDLDSKENISKFNEQFANYDRDVEGHEILSLINQIIDYNERNTADSTIKAGTFKPIKMKIDLNGKNENLTYSEASNLLFINNKYESEISAGNRNKVGSFKHDIEDVVTKAMKDLPGVGNNSEKANKVAKNIENIFINASSTNSQWKKAVSLYNSCTGANLSVDYAKTNFTRSGTLYTAACKCYEYMQFKRSVFICTNITYDNDSGLVSNINFKCVGIR